MAGKPLGRQGAGIGAGVLHFDQVAHLQPRPGKALGQHVGGAAQVAHDVHRLGDAVAAVGHDGKGPFRSEQRLIGRQRSVARGVAQHDRQRRLLQAVHAVFGDDVGLAPGEFFVHHLQPVGAGLGGGEPARFDHQPGFQRNRVIGGDSVGVGAQPLQIHGLFIVFIVSHADAAAEVDIPQVAVQRLLHPLGQRPAVPVAAAQHIGVQILRLQVDVDPLHRHGNGVQQRLQLGQILLVDAEFAGAA